MKTLSGTFVFKLVLLAAIAIVAAYAFRAFATATPAPTPAAHAQKFSLKIGKKEVEPLDYADVTTEGDFLNELRVLCNHPGGHIKIHFKRNNGDETDYSCESIETTKVTTSGAVHSDAAGESAANDPNATYRVYSNNAADMANVLKTFKATPTPTPST